MTRYMLVLCSCGVESSAKEPKLSRNEHLQSVNCVQYFVCFSLFDSHILDWI